MKKSLFIFLIVCTIHSFYSCSDSPHSLTFKEQVKQYSPETQKRINHVINNLKANTSLVNNYKTASLDERLQFYQTPGICIALIDEGKVDWVIGKGVKEWGKNSPIDGNTLFQVASISKPITTLAVLRLKEKNMIDLDKDVNSYLKSWKIPSNEGWQPIVTTRQILSHTGGLTLSSFPGYLFSEELPGTVNILNGTKPANNGSVMVNIISGTQHRYSGGGFVAVQLLLEDVLDKSFSDIMDSEIIKPLELENSTFKQPLPEKLVEYAAKSHPNKYQKIEGNFRIYPELAAAGLWSSANDLAKIIIEIQKAFNDNSNFISKKSIKEMLTPQKIAPYMGLGFFLGGKGDSINFNHSGGNTGYSSKIIGYPYLGKGAVILINSNQGWYLMDEVLRSIAIEYNWPDYILDEKNPIELNSNIFKKYVGNYKTENNLRFIVTLSETNKLLIVCNKQNPIELKAEAENKFYAEVLNIEVEFKNDKMILTQGGKSYIAERI